MKTFTFCARHIFFKENVNVYINYDGGEIMKRMMFATIALGLFAASTVVGAAALPHAVRAEETDAGNRTLYRG